MAVVEQRIDDYQPDRQLVADETVHFALDDKVYQIDLAAENARLLRDTLEQWIVRARPADPRYIEKLANKASQGIRVKRGNASRAMSREQSAAIRDWAVHQGMDVPARGRLSAHIIEAFEQAHGGSSGAPAFSY